MLGSTVELVVGLCLIVLPLMSSFGIVGSIVAALRAVSRERPAVNLRKEGITMARGERKNRRERPRLGSRDPDHLLKIVQDLDQHNYREGKLDKRTFPTRGIVTVIGD